MRPERVIRQMCARLLARNGTESIQRSSRIDRCAAKFCRGNRGQQRVPVDTPRAADDIDARYARSLDDVVTDAGRLDARHLADVAHQFAGDAQFLVAVIVEESQYAGLQCLHHTAAATTDVGEAGYRLRADSMPRLVALRCCETCVESRRRPTEQFQAEHIDFEPAGNAANFESLGEQSEIEIACADVGKEFREPPER